MVDKPMNIGVDQMAGAVQIYLNPGEIPPDRHEEELFVKNTETDTSTTMGEEIPICKEYQTPTNQNFLNIKIQKAIRAAAEVAHIQAKQEGNLETMPSLSRI